MTDDIMVYLAPVLIFTVGAIVIYRLVRYYLNRMTDFWGTDKSQKPPDFNFRSTEAWWVLAILTIAVAVTLSIFYTSKIKRQHHYQIEKDALEQYKDQIENDVRRDILDDFQEEYQKKLRE